MSNVPLQILHLSDLHFGRISQEVLDSLSHFIQQRKDQLHLIILTGDLTQRARSHEFTKAREFLNQLPVKVFMVPGNHDIPLYNLIQRLFSPYRKFCHHLGPYSEQFYEDEHLAVVGLWTTNNFTIKNATIKSKEIKQALKQLESTPKHKLKMVASHHPLINNNNTYPPGITALIEKGSRFFLSGHEHQSQVKAIQPGVYALASGTSASNRTREEVNSFNLIHLQSDSAEIEIFHYSAENRNFHSSFRDTLAFS